MTNPATQPEDHPEATHPERPDASHPHRMTDAVLCLFRTARACMLPFFVVAMRGDVEAASTAILQMVSAYNFATPVELDLVARIITFSAAAMDSLRQSMQPDLSDITIRNYRANAIALDRSAEQCRKVLQVIQATRQNRPAQAAASRPIPASAPAPSFPTAPSNPAPQPPPQPKAEAHPTAKLDDDFDFETDIETMRRNALAMIAELQAMAPTEHATLAEAPLSQTAPRQNPAFQAQAVHPRAQAAHPRNAATP